MEPQRRLEPVQQPAIAPEALVVRVLDARSVADTARRRVAEHDRGHRSTRRRRTSETDRQADHIDRGRAVVPPSVLVPEPRPFEGQERQAVELLDGPAGERLPADSWTDSAQRPPRSWLPRT